MIKSNEVDIMKNEMIVDEDGDKCWYLNGKLHNEDGPEEAKGSTHNESHIIAAAESEAKGKVAGYFVALTVVIVGVLLLPLAFVGLYKYLAFLTTLV